MWYSFFCFLRKNNRIVVRVIKKEYFCKSKKEIMVNLLITLLDIILLRG